MDRGTITPALTAWLLMAEVPYRLERRLPPYLVRTNNIPQQNHQAQELQLIMIKKLVYLEQFVTTDICTS